MPNAYTRTTNIKLSEAERAALLSVARSRSVPSAQTMDLAARHRCRWRRFFNRPRCGRRELAPAAMDRRERGTAGRV